MCSSGLGVVSNKACSSTYSVDDSSNVQVLWYHMCIHRKQAVQITSTNIIYIHKSIIKTIIHDCSCTYNECTYVPTENVVCTAQYSGTSEQGTLYGPKDFVPCRERQSLSLIIHYYSISMGLKQVSIVERSSLSRRFPYWRLHKQ